MTTSDKIDGVLVQWGERLFFPGNRIVRSTSPRLSMGQRANAIRQRIRGTVVRRAPQVMVKVTGGGRGMASITAHLRYISKSGRLPFEDDRGVSREGKEALHDLVEQWRHGGSFIDQTSHRREAFNIMLSMPSGTDPLIVQRAAREFAQTELADHRYVMVLHDHQANPHVHLSVRAESRSGKRLNPRRADLQRWRETFAEKLRGWGIDAEASRQRTRGQTRQYPSIGRVKAAAEGRLRSPVRTVKSGEGIDLDQAIAADAWRRIADGLGQSQRLDDRALGQFVDRFFANSRPEPQREIKPREPTQARTVDQALKPKEPTREGPDIRR